MPQPQIETGRRYIRALLIALGGAVLVLTASIPLFRLIERPFMRQLLALTFTEKNQGMFLQREAFQRSDVLPLYGSSELTTAMGCRPDYVFRHKPLGFQVSSVGDGGNTTLLMAEKIAALGGAVRGQKVVILLSPIWFTEARPRGDQVAGNFSPLQAISILEGHHLDGELRLRFVNRMLRFRASLDPHPLILERLRSFKKDGRPTKTKNFWLRARLSLQRAALVWEDHLNTVGTILEDELARMEWREQATALDWDGIIDQVEGTEDKARKLALQQGALLTGGQGDEAFLSALAASEEWGDFELLLDTLKALKAEALVISIPMPGLAYNGRGVSRAAREVYYRRIESMSVQRGFAVATFSDHDLDADFIVGKTAHFTTKGWLYANRLMDDFFHGRLPTSGL